MKQVGASIADEEGKPKDLLSTPTSVWCFLDKGKTDLDLEVLHIAGHVDLLPEVILLFASCPGSSCACSYCNVCVPLCRC